MYCIYTDTNYKIDNLMTDVQFTDHHPCAPSFIEIGPVLHENLSRQCGPDNVVLCRGGSGGGGCVDVCVLDCGDYKLKILQHYSYNCFQRTYNICQKNQDYIYYPKN